MPNHLATAGPALPWQDLPDPVLIQILCRLPARSLLNASQTCKHWHQVALDEFLWKALFHCQWGSEINCLYNSNGEHSSVTWRGEYRRLHFETPCCESEVLREHRDQVLHVTFSHDGRLFATCSKDGYVKVWNANYPASVKYYANMHEFNWKYTQFAQFNRSDTLLLVSGVHFGSHSTSGEIAIFSVIDGFELQCRVLNKPYDVFGSWYNDSYLLSGNVHWLGNMTSCSVLWLNKAYQALESEQVSVVMRLFKFYNVNANSVRTILIADCIEDRSNIPDQPQTCDSVSDAGMHQTDTATARPDISGDSDKLLIYTTGLETYTPHCIGVKRIHSLEAEQRLRSHIGEQAMIAGAGQAFLELMPGVAEPVLGVEPETFDYPDHMLDMHGHIIGMCLSPDHRFLYVNCRAWPPNYHITNALNPPPIAQQIDIHVIDLRSMHVCDTVLHAHKAYTPNDDCFFVFLDVCNDYVASGSEDNHGYIWDRRYGTFLTKLPHSDVVNSVAFNPRDSQMLVTVSDDHSVKIWRSRKRERQLQEKQSRKAERTKHDYAK